MSTSDLHIHAQVCATIHACICTQLHKGKDRQPLLTAVDVKVRAVFIREASEGTFHKWSKKQMKALLP